MPDQASKAFAFRALHARSGAFLIPNPWDAGTAKILTHLGFEALATTSAGLAFALGRSDGAASREETLANARRPLFRQLIFLYPLTWKTDLGIHLIKSQKQFSLRLPPDLLAVRSRTRPVIRTSQSMISIWR